MVAADYIFKNHENTKYSSFPGIHPGRLTE